MAEGQSSNVGTAFGAMASRFGQIYSEKKKREHDEELKHIDLVNNLVKSGLESGSIENPQDAFQFLLSNMQGKGGKGAKGKKAELPPMLKTIIGATQKSAGGGEQTAGGQEKPSFPTPGAPTGDGTPQFTTPQQKEQRELDMLRKKGDLSVEESGKKVSGDLEAKKRLADRWIAGGMKPEDAYERVGLKVPLHNAKWVAGTVPGSSLPPNATDIYGNAIDPQKHYRQGTDNEGNQSFVPTETPSKQQPGAEGTFTKYVADALEEKKPKTAAEKRKLIDDLSTEWAKSHQSMTFAEKVSLAKQRATALQDVKGSQVGDVEANAQYANIGGEPRGYINLSDYGATERAKAREDALKAGLTPLTAAQAQKVEDASGAVENATMMLDQIKTKLPDSYKDRPWSALKNLTFKEIQADDALASYQAWGVTTMATVRSLGAMGRITNLELNQAKDALPKITDTVGVAAEKTAILTGMLSRAMERVLTRGQEAKAAITDKGGDQKNGPVTETAKDVQARLKDAPAALYHDTKTGTYWRKSADGTIKAISKAEYDK